MSPSVWIGLGTIAVCLFIMLFDTLMMIVGLCWYVLFRGKEA